DGQNDIGYYPERLPLSRNRRMNRRKVRDSQRENAKMRLTKLLACVALAATMVVPAWVAQADTSLRLAHQFAPDSLPGQSAARFADLVSSKTDGAVTVTVLAAGALGDERANLQQLSSGTI